MLAIFENILPIFALVMLGFGLRKSNFVEADKWQIVDELCFWVFFPALLAYTLIKADFSQIQLGAVTIVLLLAVLITAAVLLAVKPFLARVVGVKNPQFTTIFQTVSRYHGFIALAIVLELFGEAGTAIVALSFAVLVPVNQFINIVVLVAYDDKTKFNLKGVTLGVVKNPIFMAAIIGLAISLLNIPVWKPIVTGLDLLADVALGLSLLALGAGLSLKAALSPSKEMWIGVLGRVVGVPLLMGVLCYFFGVRGMSAHVLMVLAAVPAAMNGYVLAKKMGGDAPLYAATLTVQTVVSFVSVPAVLWLSQAFLS